MAGSRFPMSEPIESIQVIDLGVVDASSVNEPANNKLPSTVRTAN